MKIIIMEKLDVIIVGVLFVVLFFSLAVESVFTNKWVILIGLLAGVAAGFCLFHMLLRLLIKTVDRDTEEGER